MQPCLFEQASLQGAEAILQAAQQVELGGKPRVAAAFALQTLCRLLLQLQLVNEKERACFEREIALFACDVAIEAVYGLPKFADTTIEQKSAMKYQFEVAKDWLAKG
jgi:hypothetical protein